MIPMEKEPLRFLPEELFNGTSLILIKDSGENQVGYIYWSPENMNYALNLTSGVLYFDELQQILAEMERLTEEKTKSWRYTFDE